MSSVSHRISSAGSPTGASSSTSHSVQPPNPSSSGEPGAVTTSFPSDPNPSAAIRPSAIFAVTAGEPSSRHVWNAAGSRIVCVTNSSAAERVDSAGPVRERVEPPSRRGARRKVVVDELSIPVHAHHGVVARDCGLQALVLRGLNPHRRSVGCQPARSRRRRRRRTRRRPAEGRRSSRGWVREAAPLRSRRGCSHRAARVPTRGPPPRLRRAAQSPRSSPGMSSHSSGSSVTGMVAAPVVVSNDIGSPVTGCAK